MNAATAREARRALTRAIVVLTERRGLTDDLEERQEIEIELPKLEQKKALIHQLIIGEKLPTLRAPTSAEVAAVSKAARDLDNIAAANTTASAVLTLARTAADVIRT